MEMEVEVEAEADEAFLLLLLFFARDDWVGSLGAALPRPPLLCVDGGVGFLFFFLPLVLLVLLLALFWPAAPEEEEAKGPAAVLILAPLPAAHDAPVLVAIPAMGPLAAA